MSRLACHDEPVDTEPVVEVIKIAAAPETVYDLVADVTRMGEWSPEATGARRVRGRLSAGDTFIGTNRRGLFSWATECTVLAAEPGEEFAFDVHAGPIAVSRWEYTFQPDGYYTVVTESWTDLRRGIGGLVIKGVGQVLIPGPRPAHNRANMRATLRRLKAAAESQQQSDRT